MGSVMKFKALHITLGVSLMALSACELGGAVGPDKTRDRGTDSKPLTESKAGIWVDPNGCQHWIIDDGVEGYMDARRTPDGRSVCDDTMEPTGIYGDFKSGGSSLIGDPL